MCQPDFETLCVFQPVFEYPLHLRYLLHPKYLNVMRPIRSLECSDSWPVRENTNGFAWAASTLRLLISPLTRGNAKKGRPTTAPAHPALEHIACLVSFAASNQALTDLYNFFCGVARLHSNVVCIHENILFHFFIIDSHTVSNTILCRPCWKLHWRLFLV